MSDLGYSETVFDHYRGNNYWSISTGEKKWKNKLQKLEKEFPDEVKCIAKNDEGGVFYHVPERFVALRKPRQVNINLTEAQIAERTERLREAREKRKVMSSGQR